MKDSPTNISELRRALQSKQKKIDTSGIVELEANATTAEIIEMVNKIIRALKK